MRKILQLLVLLFISNLGLATDYTAISSGPFSNPATWDANGVPPVELMSGDRIIINSGVQVDFFLDFTVNSGELINNGTINLFLDVQVNTGMFTNNGLLIIDNISTFENLEGLFTNSNTGTITLTNNGDTWFINHASATLVNDGTINNNGRFFSCSPISDVTGNPVEQIPPGFSCLDDGIPTTQDIYDENCNCLHIDYSAELYVNGIDGPIIATQGNFTPDICDIGLLSGFLEVANPSNACNSSGPLTNNFNGNIAIIDRGACRFDNKIANAENAGASAVIVCNNEPGDALLFMSGDPIVDIPAIFISYDDCQKVKMQEGNWARIGREACGVAIPTLSQWGIIVLSMIMVIFGVITVRQRKTIFA